MVFGTVVVGGGGAGSQTMGEHPPVVAALPERIIEIRRYFWSERGNLSQGIMLNLQFRAVSRQSSENSLSRLHCQDTKDTKENKKEIFFVFFVSWR